MKKYLLSALFDGVFITVESVVATTQTLRERFKAAYAPAFLPVIHWHRRRIGNSPTYRSSRFRLAAADSQ